MLVVIIGVALIVGSFLTVASEDPDGFDWLKRKRSKCMECGHILGFYDLFPVFSYLWLGGKCRYCGKKIAPYHLITELVTVFLFVSAYLVTPKPLQIDFIFLLVMLTLLLVLTLTDLKFWTLPDIFVGLLTLTGIIRAIVMHRPDIKDALAGAVVGFLLLGGIHYFSKGKAMGFGDVKLALAMGMVLGLGQTILALMFAFILGGLVGIVLIVLKKATAKSMVPFGPFLTIATAVLLLFPALYGRILLFYGLVYK
jgi:prepilin signal peptidase PulO-like enzyme (type II secretory pathway)